MYGFIIPSGAENFNRYEKISQIHPGNCNIISIFHIGMLDISG